MEVVGCFFADTFVSIHVSCPKLKRRLKGSRANKGYTLGVHPCTKDLRWAICMICVVVSTCWLYLDMVLERCNHIVYLWVDFQSASFCCMAKIYALKVKNWGCFSLKIWSKFDAANIFQDIVSVTCIYLFVAIVCEGFKLLLSM